MSTAIRFLPVLAPLLVCVPMSVGAADETYTLRFGTVVPDGSTLGRDLKIFAEEMAARSNGKVRVKWMYNGPAARCCATASCRR